MAWRNRPKADTNKAFGNDSHRIRDAIPRLAMAQYRMALQAFTPNDLLDLFVPKDLHDLLRDAFNEAAPRTSYELFVDTGVNPKREAHRDRLQLRFSWDHRLKGGFLPRTRAGAFSDKPAGRIYDSCPAETRERFEQTARDMGEISYRFGMAAYVFDTLNLHGKTGAAVRYHFPCVIPLLEKAGEMGMADAIREPSARSGDGLEIPPEVREFVRPANEHIARCLLLGDELPATPPVLYRVMSVTYHRKFDGWSNG